MMHRIILDANVWLRFARNKGIESLSERMELYDLVPVANNYLLSEVFDALIFNEWMNAKQGLEVAAFIEAIVVLKTEHAVFRLSPDPKDNYLFDLAIQTNCTFIISDDSELLNFNFKPVSVYSTNWFLKHFLV